MKQLRTLRILLILSACLLAGMITAFLLKPTPADNRISTQQIGGDFTLTSADGPVSLSDFKGDVAVIYIGYASCPDVCPTALAVLSQALNQLDKKQRDQVQGIFISVDPERDTPEKLKTYTRFFSDRLIGLTGSHEEIDKVVRQYGAFYRKVELEDSAMGYAVDHSSRLYLIDRNGDFVGLLNHGVQPAEVKNRLESLLNG
ncbi:SCO family protein [Marinobacterium mangrovicola]|uniref:Protein SCO1/2 n=1 Tax=Marinobacterium mangrovicola TaxID=1476959 RepID=A0A4R1G7V6_9GAMM|nr:SCO family protein [Marinobacterium mangrovicola]TCK02545.1 protein SCO1/2 [Marinobacterium mangrovicola]